jgi:hypothetical protein
MDREDDVAVEYDRAVQQSSSSTTGTETTSTSTTTTIAIPQVLTRSMISSLAITSLDAGDVIECYVLTRKSVLHGTVIQITKSALGLRYRHRPATGRKYDNSEYINQMNTAGTGTGTGTGTGSSHSVSSRRRLELTIEYGPARAGNNLGHESIPHIIVDEEPNIDNLNTGTNQTVTTSTSVNWDNEGRVYYTEYIDSDLYTSANYLASLSGTLLTKLLNSAVDYLSSASINHQPAHRRRYQPFSVYRTPPVQLNPSTDNTTFSQQEEPKLVLKSNSDADFVQHLLTVLTNLGVELKPVILPVVSEIRLHSIDMKKIQIGRNNHPVEFYQKLLACVKAIGSTDYSAYNISKAISTDSPTPSPSIVGPSIPFPSMIVRPPSYNNARRTLSPVKRYHRLLDEDDNTVPTTTLYSVDVIETTSHPTTKAITEQINDDTNNTTELFPSMTPTEDLDPGNIDGNNGMDMATHQEQAATAAQHAQEAAEAAGAADTEDEAVSAAQQAAVYAQKAATVTANQAALMARDAIMSGVGSSVAQAVSLCFSDPLYGIVGSSSTTKGVDATIDTANKGENATSPLLTTVYLYVDGTFFYRVNLTAPYITVTSYARPMPKPPIRKIGQEDFVDWTVSFLLAIVTAIGCILLLQQVMGRNFKLVRSLYRYQLWFFQPTQFDWDEMTAEGEAICDIRDKYSFGEDAIPLSMGGRKIGNVVASVFKSGSTHSMKNRSDDWLAGDDSDDYDDEADNKNGHGDMEMVDRSLLWTSTSNHSGTSRNYEKGTSFHSDGSEDLVMTDSVSEGNSIVRLLRDPNLVDLPDLTSNSKVAMPVSSLQII